MQIRYFRIRFFRIRFFRIRFFIWVLCLFALPGAVPPARAQAQDTAIASLHHFIQTVQSASGDFVQQTLEEGQGSRARAAQTGRFAFARPGRFRWETLAPHEQIITSDGATVSQYDPDLAQITHRPADASLGHSPAAILFGADDLESVFTLMALPENSAWPKGEEEEEEKDRKNRLQWLRATPRQTDAGFAHLDIGFAENVPVRLLLVDAFDQTTRIDLNAMQINPPLADTLFAQRDLPPDVDVVWLQ